MMNGVGQELVRNGIDTGFSDGLPPSTIDEVSAGDSKQPALEGPLRAITLQALKNFGENFLGYVPGIFPIFHKESDKAEHAMHIPFEQDGKASRLPPLNVFNKPVVGNTA